MELSFTQDIREHLACAARQTLYQEETAESVIPDSYPDAGRIVDCWGMVILRGKECRDGGASLSGTVRAWTLYVPEDGGQPKTLEESLPFTMRMDGNGIQPDSELIADLSLKGIDARVVNSRKILVRAELAANAAAYNSVSQTFYPAVEGEQPGLQLKTREVNVTWPVAAGEKAFVISDEVELGDRPPVGGICRWSAAPEVQERKLIGNKAVFKGSVSCWTLYRTEDGGFETFSFQLPFSQFVQLDYEGGEDEVDVSLLLTGAELEPDGLEHATRLRLNLSVLAQTLVTSRAAVTVVEDLYSTTGALIPATTAYALESRLDRQTLRQEVRETVQGPVKSVVAASVLLEPPGQSREGSRVRLRCPASVSLLFYDENGTLQGITRRVEAETALELAEGCLCLPVEHSDGSVAAVPTAGGAEVRFTVVFEVECCATEQLEAVSAAQLEPLQTENRPSVVIRAAEENETLWSIAKTCRSTCEAIRQANQLEDEETIGGKMLLIPLVS